MEFLIPKLKTKAEVDCVITQTEDKVLVLRFGIDKDIDCMHVDYIISKTNVSLKEMATIHTVDITDVPVYVEYFEIERVPATIFFFNGQHIKVDYGGPDQTKFVGPFKNKQEFIDLVEIVYRGAMSGKFLVIFRSKF